MNRREFLKAAAAAAASTALPGCGSEERARPRERPSFLIILADQLRADAVGPYGETNSATPNLDRLAAEGTTFEQGLSTAPLCTPYRGMLMTARHPTHSGIVLNRVEASPEQNPDTLGVLFSKAGWYTGYLGKWHLGAGKLAASRRLREAGAERPDDARLAGEPEPEFVPPGPRRLGFAHWEAYNFHADSPRYWFYRDEPQRIFADGYETDVLADQAIAFLEARRRDERPFLLVMSPHAPHPPLDPAHCPPGYLEQVRRDLEFRPNVPADARVRREPLPARCYYAMIRNLDDAVGRVLRALDEGGLGESTLVIFTGDHGEMLWSRGLAGKQYPYRESIQVPLIARWPGVVPAGARSDALFTPMDHLPTLCGLAGIAVPGYLDGRDMGAALRGADGGPREAALLMNAVPTFRSFRHRPESGRRSVAEWRGVQTTRFTYVRWRTGAEELYDNREDPYQLRDVAGDGGYAGALADLRERLPRLMAEAHDEFLAGPDYADWYDKERNLLRTALGPVPSI